jgi:hypothetical protein
MNTCPDYGTRVPIIVCFHCFRRVNQKDLSAVTSGTLLTKLQSRMDKHDHNHIPECDTHVANRLQQIRIGSNKSEPKIESVTPLSGHNFQNRSACKGSSLSSVNK